MRSLRAHSQAEAYLYLKVTPCPECAAGPWEVREQPGAGEAPPGRQALRARCLQCGTEQEFAFECAEAPPEQPLPAGGEVVNPTGAASEIIDLGQWLSLFYFYAESADRTADKAEVRRLTFRAAQCLDEALKFYRPADELPPPSAFFVDSSRQAFADHPERFARQRLRDMRSKLPDLRLMARRLALDAQGKPPRRWWPFRRKRG